MGRTCKLQKVMGLAGMWDKVPQPRRVGPEARRRELQGGGWRAGPCAGCPRLAGGEQHPEPWGWVRGCAVGPLCFPKGLCEAEGG